MARQKSVEPAPQCSFDFDAATLMVHIIDPIAVSTGPETHLVEAATAAVVIRFDDRRRRLHFEKVRRLLAETGVFDTI